MFLLGKVLVILLVNMLFISSEGKAYDSACDFFLAEVLVFLLAKFLFAGVSARGNADLPAGRNVFVSDGGSLGVFMA